MTGMGWFGAGALLARQGVENHAAHFTGASYVSATADPDVYEFDGAVSIEFWIRLSEMMLPSHRTECVTSQRLILVPGKLINTRRNN